MVNIVLVFSPTDPDYLGIDYTYLRLLPQSGLAILACETERRSRSTISVKILHPGSVDGNLIRDVSNADYLGISLWFHNHVAGMELATRAKRLNPQLKVIAGGCNSANLGKKILENRRSIDMVVHGDGEDTLWRIVDGHAKETIPNLWYRDEDEEVAFSFHQEIDLDSIGTWDFRHVPSVDFSRYDTRSSQYSFDPSLLPVSISMTRGCMKACYSRRCSYCSMVNRSFRTTSPDRVWRQIEHLHSLYGLEAYFESGDDFTAGDYIQDLLRDKPKNLPFKLRIYAGARNLNGETVDLLAKLGVYEIFLGVETADDDLNLRADHFSTKTDVLSVLGRLEQAGISVCLPFIFGLPGETADSAMRTKVWAEELVSRFKNVRMVLISLAIPLVGSAWFESLRKDRSVCTEYFGETMAHSDLNGEDIVDYSVLWYLSNKSQCNLILHAYDQLRADISGKVLVGDYGGLREHFRRRFGY